jgi:hypothetical protein
MKYLRVDAVKSNSGLINNYLDISDHGSQFLLGGWRKTMEDFVTTAHDPCEIWTGSFHITSTWLTTSPTVF